ncbi:hypothetical protein J8273_1201 [Carpediemonas membranifera]|uniref:Uncharacterized protein n=1 Tax=Carpediemonas membranifera TaxID=201153 RepID=A0A8J6E4R9_9EUKA|nr:hypothetical protein J8273_1201 [Carpediemonas membranifera]|eukprot:KAG9397286.1 hypothetical protein J8273_1201 [Carpediemonas membranifera]
MKQTNDKNTRYLCYKLSSLGYNRHEIMLRLGISGFEYDSITRRRRSNAHAIRTLQASRESYTNIYGIKIPGLDLEEITFTVEENVFVDRGHPMCRGRGMGRPASVRQRLPSHRPKHLRRPSKIRALFIQFVDLIL